MRIPNALDRCFRGEQHDPLVLAQHEAFDEHEADKGLAQSDAIAQEGPAVLTGDLHERPVRLSLVLVELVEHLGFCSVPLATR